MKNDSEDSTFFRQPLSRRSALNRLVAGGALLGGAAATQRHPIPSLQAEPAKTKGNVNHSVCKWCYKDVSLEDLCKSASNIGLSSIELLNPDDWPVLSKYNLICAMANGPHLDGIGGITKAFNRREHHDRLAEGYARRIPKVANAGFPNVICFSGNREGLDDEQGLQNCAIGLKRIMPIAEKYKVTVCMELLNSKVNHPDYQCDHTSWGVELVKRVGSERFKLLYDIYHMQIMEGDLIATITKNIEHIAHFHTGGVPGRGEIDESQEIYYPAVMRAIVDTGFKGFVAQEFVPKRPDALASLKQGVQICDV